MNIFEQIKIGSSFDAKGFKQAETASQKLNKSVKSLAKTFGVAFGTSAVVAFGKASVKAFIQDDNAARSLGITLKNLGLETGNTSIYINDLISRMEKQTGVIDDQLRPAMDRLLRATGSITKAQDLLALALDISAGTGKDLTTVSQGLQKAYLGNTASLGRLGVGLSKAELTSSSFEKIQKRLSVLFAGQASSAAESYAGQLNKLAIAGNNVKEIIGKGIVDSLVVLSEDKTVSNLASDMESLATYTADVIRGFGLMAAAIQKIPGVGGLKGADIIQAIPILGSYITLLNQAGAKARRIEEVAAGKNPIQSGTYLKKITKLNTDQTKAAQAQLKLSKAKAIFDLQKIQIEAALKGKISEEDRIRLKLMRAIEQENISDIEKYTKLLDEAQAKTKALADLLAIVKAAEGPKFQSPAGSEFYRGMSEAEIALEKFKESGKFRIGNIISEDFYRGMSEAQIALERFIESGKLRMAGIGMASAVPAAAATSGGAFTDSQNWARTTAPTPTAPVVNNVTVNAGVGDPNAIAEAVEDVLVQARYRGTLRGLIAL